ncbi:MAG: arginase [Deinococcus sp.]|nr:arginase [Deinococcus sp.]
MERQVVVMGVPMDLGQGRRGVDMGPSAVRYARLHDRLRQLGHTVEDWGDIPVPVPEAVRGVGGMRHLPAIRDACQGVYRQAKTAVEAGAFPVFLGGDHSIAMGTVAGVAGGERLGLVWIDAHADFNTPETSPSGNIHGMPLGVLAGDGPAELVNLGYAGAKVRPEDVVVIGLRSVDPEERVRVKQRGLNVYTMKDIDARGAYSVAQEAIEHLKPLGRMHVSLDMDGLDPDIAPGVGTPEPGGLSYREAHLLMELLCDCGLVTSLDLVEINPILDIKNRTAELAVELAASLLGKSIL